MPLYCKVFIKSYGLKSEVASKATLGDLKHEARRLDVREDGEQDPDLVFKTPYNVSIKSM